MFQQQGYSQQFNPYNNPQMALANSQLLNRMQNTYQPDYQGGGGLQFVNGKQSAEAYIMPPNSQVILMDKYLPRFYLKETDASGIAKITAYSFSEVVDTPEQSIEYITRKEFDEWKTAYESSISKQPSDATAKSTDTANTTDESAKIEF